LFLLSYLIYFLGEKMRRQYGKYSSKIVQEDIRDIRDIRDIALVTDEHIVDATDKLATRIRDLIVSVAPGKSAQQEDKQQDKTILKDRALLESILEGLYSTVESSDAIWKDNRPVFLSSDYSRQEKSQEDKEKTDLLMQSMLLKDCEILTGDKFVKISQQGQPLTPTEYKQEEEDNDQPLISKEDNDQPLISKEDIEQIKSRINKILEQERNRLQDFIVILYPNYGALIVLDGRAGNNGELRGQILIDLLDEEIKKAISEQSKRDLKTALCDLAAEPDKATQAVANSFSTLGQDVIGLDLFGYFMKGIVTLAIPHLQETYKQYRPTPNIEEARSKATNTLLRGLADTLEKQGPLYWAHGFYIYLKEVLQTKNTKYSEVLPETPPAFVKLQNDLAQIEFFLISLKQNEEQLTAEEIKQINAISIYLRTLISLGRHLGVFPENPKGSTFGTKAEAKREIKIIEEFILPFIPSEVIPSEDSTVKNLLSFVTEHTPDMKDINLWLNGLTESEQKNAKKITREQIKLLFSLKNQLEITRPYASRPIQAIHDFLNKNQAKILSLMAVPEKAEKINNLLHNLTGCIRHYGTLNEKHTNTLLLTLYHHALQSVLVDAGANDAKESQELAAASLLVSSINNEQGINPNAKKNIDIILTELAQKAEANKIPANDIARMTMAIVGLFNNKSNANRFSDKKYLWATLKIIAYMETLHAKKDTQELVTSLLTSTTAFLNNPSQPAELITSIKPVYEGLVTAQQHTTKGDKAISKLKEATETFFASKEKNIHNRYDTFKQDCKTQESHLSLGMTVLKAVTKFFAFLVGISPAIIDGLRFFKNVRANYVDDVANVIEPVRGEIRKQEKQERKPLLENEQTVGKPTEGELNSAEAATESAPPAGVMPSFAEGSQEVDESDDESSSVCSQNSYDDHPPSLVREETPVSHDKAYPRLRMWQAHPHQPSTKPSDTPEPGEKNSSRPVSCK
jgi:hypothetical protein